MTRLAPTARPRGKAARRAARPPHQRCLQLQGRRGCTEVEQVPRVGDAGLRRARRRRALSGGVHQGRGAAAAVGPRLLPPMCVCAGLHLFRGVGRLRLHDNLKCGAPQLQPQPWLQTARLQAHCAASQHAHHSSRRQPTHLRLRPLEGHRRAHPCLLLQLLQQLLLAHRLLHRGRQAARPLAAPRRAGPWHGQRRVLL